MKIHIFFINIIFIISLNISSYAGIFPDFNYGNTGTEAIINTNTIVIDPAALELLADIAAAATCACSSDITKARDNIIKYANDWEVDVITELDELKNVLIEEQKEIQFREVDAGIAYKRKLLKYLNPLGIMAIHSDEILVGIEGYLQKVKLSKTTSEIRRLNELLFETRRLRQIKIFNAKEKIQDENQ